MPGAASALVAKAACSTPPSPTLCSVLDATFISWAMDRDASTISQPEVHNEFAALPLKTATGAVVENPGGQVAYGAELAIVDATSAAAANAAEHGRGPDPHLGPSDNAGDEQQQQRVPLLAGVSSPAS